MSFKDPARRSYPGAAPPHSVRPFHDNSNGTPEMSKKKAARLGRLSCERFSASHTSLRLDTTPYGGVSPPNRHHYSFVASPLRERSTAATLQNAAAHTGRKHAAFYSFLAQSCCGNRFWAGNIFVAPLIHNPSHFFRLPIGNNKLP